jgi:hypothetical protein
MFLNEGDRRRFVETATEDLWGFLQNSEGGGDFTTWEGAYAQARALHHKFPHCERASEFIVALFAFLDANPIAAVSEVPQVSEMRVFLKELHRWLENFASADEMLPEFYGTSHIMDFGHFVAQTLERKLHWTNASTGVKTENGRSLKGFPKGSFVSWTIVMDRSNIHIIYDKERMLSAPAGPRPPFLVQQIFERVLLHEIGHARLQLGFFDFCLPGQASKPVHETEAWLYALVIRTLVIATRARVDRYLGLADSAYPL